MHLPPGEDFLLLSSTEQAVAYRNVDRMFATRTVPRPATPHLLPRGTEIAPSYMADGMIRSVEDYIRPTGVAGLLVLKHGRIMLEHYALGLEEPTRWSTMSMVKSITATLLGAAIHDGAAAGLGVQVGDIVSELKGSAYDRVTIRDLITMSSGIRSSELYTDRNSDVNRYSASLGRKIPGGVLALMRTLPAEAAPGTRFNYNTGDTYVLGCVISAATGRTLADYLSQTLWSPLGMEFDAFYTLESEGGQEIGGSRAGMALRDLGRLGAFLAGDGSIAGRSVLPPGWLDLAATSHFYIDPAQNSYGATGYGYSWWIAPGGAMLAVGFAGQSMYVNRAEGVVIVTLSCWPQPPFDTGYAIDRKSERLAFNAAVVAALRDV